LPHNDTLLQAAHSRNARCARNFMTSLLQNAKRYAGFRHAQSHIQREEQTYEQSARHV
jgi:hypothetical protein